TEKRFPASTSGAGVTTSPASVRTFEPLEVPPDLPQHRLDVEYEVRLQVGQLLERVLQRVARALGIGERVHQDHRVIPLEGLAVPRAVPPVPDPLLREELSAAPPARPLDLHAISLCSLGCFLVSSPGCSAGHAAGRARYAWISSTGRSAISH